MFLALMVASLAALEPVPENSSYPQQKQAYASAPVAAKMESRKLASQRPGASSLLLAVAENDITRAGNVPFTGQNVPGAGQ